MILAIYGSGATGQEIYEIVKQINSIELKWEQVVFIDDTKPVCEVAGTKCLPFEVFTQNYSVDNTEVVIGLGEPYYRKILAEKTKSLGYKLGKVIHPSVNIPDTAIVEDGVIVGVNAFISVNTFIGENTLIQPMSVVGHDTHVGKNTVVSIFSFLAGHCNLGDQCYLAMSVPVKEGTTIGSDSIVGIGSVVVRDIPPNSIALGNPARVMKHNDEKKVFK